MGLHFKHKNFKYVLNKYLFYDQVFVNGNCSYGGEVVLEIPTSTAEKCHEECLGFRDCQYFKYNKETTTCYFLDSSKQKCDLSYGTQFSSLLDCITPITTTNIGRSSSSSPITTSSIPGKTLRTIAVGCKEVNSGFSLTPLYN